MRVAFDAICLGDGPITGVGRSFLNGLAEYAAEWPDDMVVLAPDGGDRSELPDIECVRAPRGALRRQRGLPSLLRDLRADLLHSSVAAVPLRAPCPTVATVHDLPWLHPESGERSTWWRRFATRRALRSASVVIAPSQFTLEAAAQLVGCRDKLRRIPHTTTPRQPPDTAARTGPFLVLGDDRARKNRARVRAGHRLAQQRDPSLPTLRFIGPPDDFVSETEKARLLCSCRAVVACSLYEGFGMPVLEALAHGAPLICSDLPPHREITDAISDSAARYVDPTSIDAIADALAKPIAASPIPPPTTIAPAWRLIHQQALDCRSP